LRRIMLQSSLGYKAHKIKRVWITKTNSDKKRPLGIPTMRDRTL
jgi:retron-type reverse transcriptase